MAIFVTEIPVIDEATNKFGATGGVIKPIQKFIIRTIPRWIGSIPIFVTRAE